MKKMRSAFGTESFSGNHVAGKDVSGAVNFRSDSPWLAVPTKSASVDFEGAEAFLQAFLERAPDGHGFADAFHLRDEREWRPCASTLRELLEGKARPAMAGLVTA